uniref:Ovule protein n=1 Tax=Dracunculus medinensis TaxID=318479 RepID=A0A0N4UQ60_DRAME
LSKDKNRTSDFWPELYNTPAFGVILPHLGLIAEDNQNINPYKLKLVFIRLYVHNFWRNSLTFSNLFSDEIILTSSAAHTFNFQKSFFFFISSITFDDLIILVSFS